MRRTFMVAVGVLVFLGAYAASAYAAQCRVTVRLQNDTRRVPGPVNVECGTGTEYMHSAPYGNWGVDSSHGRKRDGYQFSGWYRDDDWYQWNSCTSTYTGGHLPHGATQRADPDNTNTHAYRTRKMGPRNVPCRNIFASGTYVVGRTYMKLWELDTNWDRILGGNGSDHVVTLRYPTLRVAMRCSSRSYCQGYSPWKQPFHGAKAKARVRAYVTTSYY